MSTSNVPSRGRFTRPRQQLLISLSIAVACFGTTYSPITNAEPVLPIVTPEDARTHGLESLKVLVDQEGVPLPSNLGKYVKDIEAAKILGKALFHEQAVGSDNVQACVTCHFRAGADPRSRNQLSPGLLQVENQSEGQILGFFNARPDGDEDLEVGGMDYQLTLDDFPFVRDIGNGDAVDDNTNDVTSSQGVHFTWFDSVREGGAGTTPDDKCVRREGDGEPNQSTDYDTEDGVDCGRDLEDIHFFEGFRRVEPRNTPSTINAVFNFTQFWDGRGNHKFNGENPFGKQDKVARIFMATGKNKKIKAVPLNMEYASLASQGDGPPLSHFEMSFGNGANNFRIFPEIGRKLLSRKVLAAQAVHDKDSLLTKAIQEQKYEELFEAAFQEAYLHASQCVEIPAPTMNPGRGNAFGINLGKVDFIDCDEPDAYTLMEANFAFLWGLAIMLYEAELVAHRTPFDKWLEGDGSYVSGFGERQLAGLNVFVNEGKCINCHGGPELTNASVRNAQGGNNMLEPMLMGDKQPALYDNGFYNIGVTPTFQDLGRGAPDPFGTPLAFTRQFAFEALDVPNTQPIRFDIIGAPIRGLVCDPNDPDDPELDEANETCETGVLGFIDEESGDFFPVCQDGNDDGLCGTGDELLLQRVAVDGAFKTPGLRMVAETAPYFHNGSAATLMEVVEFYDRGGNFCRTNKADLDPDIQVLDLSDEQKNNLVRFLIALTDARVVKRKKPFDGPSYVVPNWQGYDEFTVPAVGAAGQDEYGNKVGWTPGFLNDGTSSGGAGLWRYHRHATPVVGQCSPDFDIPEAE